MRFAQDRVRRSRGCGRTRAVGHRLLEAVPREHRRPARSPAAAPACASAGVDARPAPGRRRQRGGVQRQRRSAAAAARRTGARRGLAGAGQRQGAASSIVGIKFDQPGLGLKNPDGTFSGFDVEVAKYVAKQARASKPANIEFKETPSPPSARGADRTRRGRLHRRHLLDHRHPQGEGQLRRSVLRRPSGPAGQVRQHRHHRTGRDDRQDPLLGHRLDLGAEGQGQVRRGRRAAGIRHLLRCVEALKTGAVDAVTTDDVILAGFAAQSPGELRWSARASPTRTTASA